MLKAFCELYPGQVTVTGFATRLTGIPRRHERIGAESVEELIRAWQPDLAKFRALAAPHLLYP